MIVPGDEPRKRGVGCLEQRIGAVLRVAVAVVVERRQFWADMLTKGSGIGRHFVDVVAKMYDEVESVLGHMVVGGEVALFPVLTRGKGEFESRRQGIAGRQRAAFADGAD